VKVLLCNKYNYPFSGTEVYLFELMDLLRERGHQLATFSMSHPSNVPSLFEKHFVPYADFRDPDLGPVKRLRLAQRAVYSVDARRRLRGLLSDFRPDVAHVRNVYHHLSPSIYWELKKHGVPVVYHLNDFKLLCPNYNLVSHGRVCERCIRGAFHNVVTERCHGDSLAENLVLAAEAYVHRWLGTYRRCVTRFIAPSAFCRAKLVESGWPSERIDVLPHFQVIPPEAAIAPGDDYVLCSGRLSAEKGVSDLLEAMARLPHIRLLLAGDGPQRAELQRLAERRRLGNVEFRGHVDRSTLYRLIRGARFTIMPSRAYETLGKVILESYALGRAVVAARVGTRPELVREGETGLLFEPADVGELAARISFLHSRPELCLEMGKRAQRAVIERYSPERHYAGLMSIYRAAMEPDGVHAPDPTSRVVN